MQKLRAQALMKRRKSYRVMIGSVAIGAGAPIAVQSMTNTDTADIEATAAQILELAEAGAELVRVTVNNEDAARAVPKIKEKLEAACSLPFGGQSGPPLIGDFHYNGHILLSKFPECATALDKYRINPGNAGNGFDAIIETALKYGKPVRIGANWGSIDRVLLMKNMDKNAHIKHPKSDKTVLIETLVQSALDSAKRAEKLGMAPDKIVLSVKTSEIQDVVAAYELLAKQCRYALHLGLTEAGLGAKGLISSSAALAILLQKGIGDTIRISLTSEARKSGVELRAAKTLAISPRTKEVEACQLLLQSLGLRQFRPTVTSCPGCGRTGNELFQHLAREVDEYVKKRMPEWKRQGRKVENLKIAVMGCVVNGPGEARYADIALSLPGKSEEPIASVFVKGKLRKTLRGGDVGKDFLEILNEYVTHQL